MISQTHANSLTALETRLLEIFPHRFNWIERLIDGQWTTETRYPIRDAVLIEKWLDPFQIIGLRFGKTTSYAMLDIDRGSPYHPHNGGNLAEIFQALEPIGIVQPLVVRSSDSGGLHIYLPLPNPVGTFKLACLLRQTLQEANLTIKQGWLEVFPNVKSYGRAGNITNYNGHRLPLQQGSFLLHEDLTHYSSDLSVFLSNWDFATNCQDIELLEKKLKKAKNNRWQSDALYTGNVVKWRQHLESSLKRGFISKGKTNQILLDCLQQGVVFLAKTGEALAQYMYNTIKSLPGFDKFCGHKTDLYKRVIHAIKWNERYQVYTAYCSHTERDNITQKIRALETELNPKNQDRKTSAQERIKKVVAGLTGKHYLTKRALLDDIKEKIKELFGVTPSTDTLYKNADLWQNLLKTGTEETEETVEDSSPTIISDDTVQTQTEQAVPHPPLYEGFVTRSQNSSEIPYPAPQPELPELPPLPSRPVTWEQRKSGIKAKATELAERLRQKFTAGNYEPQSEPEKIPQPMPKPKPEKISQPVPKNFPQSEPKNFGSFQIGAQVRHLLHHWHGQVKKVDNEFVHVEWNGDYTCRKTDTWLVELVE